MADIDIVIAAQDNATKVVNAAAANVDAKVRQIKEVGGRAKASTEFIGTLANTLGGSQLGSYAGQLGQLTEKIAAFSEISKAGGAGALAFKAGLAGVAAVAGFRIGKMIGDWVFETEKFTAMLSDANTELLKAADTAARIASTKLGIETEKILLIEDPEEQDIALRKYYTELSRIAEQQAANINLIKEQQAANVTTMESWFGVSDAVKAANQAEIDAAQKALEVTEAEQRRIEEKLSSDAKELEMLKQKNALKQKNESYIEGLTQELELLKATGDERVALEALQRAGGDTAAASRIESLMLEKEAILATQEAEKKAAEERQRAADKAAAEAEKLADLKKNELANLEKQRILLTQGKEAAQAFELVQKGLDQATAEMIAKQQTALDKMAEDKQKREDMMTQEPQSQGQQTPLAATESRLLTRGPGSRQDNFAMLIDKIAELIDVTEEVKDASLDNESILRDIRNNTSGTTALVPTP